MEDKEEDESLRTYFEQIKQFRLLSPEGEIELARRIQKGDKIAYEKLVNSNLRFVVSVAKNYSAEGLSLMDLIQEGNIGLMNAARRYDHKKGYRFTSYAVWSTARGATSGKSIYDISRNLLDDATFE